MKLKIISLILLFLGVAIMTQSCMPDDEMEVLIETCEVSYQDDLVPLTTTNCSGYCHGFGECFSVYEDIKVVVDNGKLWEQLIVTKEMPVYPSVLTEEQRAMFACWIEAGAPNN